MHNIYHEKGNERLIRKLKTKLLELKRQYGDTDENTPKCRRSKQNISGNEGSHTQ